MKNSLVLFTGFFAVFLVISSPQETIQSEKEFNMTNNVYKILREHEWDAALQTGEIITDLDNKDGFIHLSTATQLAVTLSFFFQDSDVVLLLQLDLAKIDQSKLLFEEPYPNKGKRRSAFPHLYSGLSTDQISNIWTLEKGSFKVPEVVLLQAENSKEN